MEHVEYFLSIMQYATDTREKRHIVGGMLLSISLFFWRYGVYCYDNEK